MKKIIASLSVFAAILSMGATSSWAYNRGKVEARTATVTTTGTKGATFTAAVKTTANPTGPAVPDNTITWTVNTDNNPAWVLANHVVELSWSVSDAKGGIQIYTDNTAADANPKFVDPSIDQPNNVDSNPAGLLEVQGGGVSNFGLDVAWSIHANPEVVSGNNLTIAASDPNNGPEGGPADKTQWFFILDQKTPNIDRNGDKTWDPNVVVNGIKDTAGFKVPTSSYYQLARTIGIHTNQSDDNSGYNSDPDKKSYVYFEADFGKASANQTYTTSKLTIEAFTE